jgi:pyruvate-formate lyase-activating enzyme
MVFLWGTVRLKYRKSEHRTMVLRLAHLIPSFCIFRKRVGAILFVHIHVSIFLEAVKIRCLGCHNPSSFLHIIMK